MTDYPTTYYEPPAPPDDTGDWLTMKQLSVIWGVSKGTVRRYVDDTERPLPFTRNDDGIIFVRREDAERYDRENPDRGKKGKRKVDRMPIEPDAPCGKYLTISEAAEALGYSKVAVRGWTKRRENPLKAYHNADGYVLLNKHELSAYAEHIEGPPDEEDLPSGLASHVDTDLSGPDVKRCHYRELEAVEGIYVTVGQASKATGLSEALIRQWMHRRDDPLPYLKKGRKHYINKYKLIDFLEKQETRQVA